MSCLMMWLLGRRGAESKYEKIKLLGWRVGKRPGGNLPNAERGTSAPLVILGAAAVVPLPLSGQLRGEHLRNGGRRARHRRPKKSHGSEAKSKGSPVSQSFDVKNASRRNLRGKRRLCVVTQWKRNERGGDKR